MVWSKLEIKIQNQRKGPEKELPTKKITTRRTERTKSTRRHSLTRVQKKFMDKNLRMNEDLTCLER